MNQTEKLLNLKQDIDNAKTNIAKGEGKKEALMTELKEQWQCTTIKQAEKKLQKHIDEAHDLNNQIEKGVTELEEKYEL
jgi:predicted Rossmann-fold nucleotide-binding protein